MDKDCSCLCGLPMSIIGYQIFRIVPARACNRIRSGGFVPRQPDLPGDVRLQPLIAFPSHPEL